MDLVEEGVDRILMGIASRGTILSEGERRVVAYHEAGHALVAMSLPGVAVPHKLTIVPRGGSLGHCAVAEPYDKVIRSQSELVDQMAVLLGGRVAEELVFGDRASGSAADLERVGELARRMVCQMGMSDALGPMAFDGAAGEARWGRSEEEARMIYAESRRLVDQGHERARAVLTGARAALDRAANALLDQETLTAAELERLVTATRSPAAATARSVKR